MVNTTFKRSPLPCAHTQPAHCTHKHKTHGCTHDGPGVGEHILQAQPAEHGQELGLKAGQVHRGAGRRRLDHDGQRLVVGDGRALHEEEAEGVFWRCGCVGYGQRLLVNRRRWGDAARGVRAQVIGEERPMAPLGRAAQRSTAQHSAAGSNSCTAAHRWGLDGAGGRWGRGRGRAGVVVIIICVRDGVG